MPVAARSVTGWIDVTILRTVSGFRSDHRLDLRELPCELRYNEPLLVLTRSSTVMSPRCPVCDRSPRPVFSKHCVTVLECARCRHRVADLEPPPDHAQTHYGDDYFTDGGDGYSNYLGDAELLRRRGRWFAELLTRHGVETGSVLDLGAAAGFLLSALVEKGWRGVGLEPNAAMVRYGEEQLGLSMIQGTLENAALTETFDLVSMVQVLAHFHDPVTAFRNAAACTAVGGHWLIETWNYRSVTARLFGRMWHQYSPPRTISWFSSSSLESLAAKFGMTRAVAADALSRGLAARPRAHDSRTSDTRSLKNPVPRR